MLGGVDGLLALDVLHQAADRHVVAIGRVIVAVRGEYAEAIAKLGLQRGFEAISADRAHIRQNRRVADDACANRLGERAVLEIDIIAGQQRVDPAIMIARADFIGVRGFGLQLVGRQQGVEPGLRGSERSARRRRDKCAGHFGEIAEQFDLIAQLVVEPGVRLEEILHLDAARGEPARHDRRGLVGDREALPAEIDRQIPERDLVLHIILHGVGFVGVVPLGRERQILEVQRIARRRGAAVEAIETPCLAEVVHLVPAANGDVVKGELGAKRAEHALAVNVIFGGAHRDRHARRGRNIRREPDALAVVGMVIALQFAMHRCALGGLDPQGREIILPQTGGVVINVIGIGVGRGGYRARRRIELGCAGIAAVCPGVGDQHRQREIVGNIVVAQPEALDHVERQILIVIFPAIRKIEGADQPHRADGRDELGVDLVLALHAIALPLVGIEKAVRDIGARPVLSEDTGVEATEGAHGIGAAIGAVQRQPEGRFRVAREKLDRTAKVVGRLCPDRTRTLRHFGTANVFGRDRAADMQAVGVAIRAVAERNAVEREADLVLVEAADRDALGPFIRAKGVGRLEVDVGQLGDGFERAGAGSQDREIGLAELLHLPRLALADDNDVAARIIHGRRSLGCRGIGSWCWCGREVSGRGGERPRQGSTRE